MRLKLLLPVLTVALLTIAGLTVWSGCEIGSATENIYIEPSSVRLEKDQSQTFTVSGGYDYTWSLSPEDGSGQLNTRHGDTVIFTLLKDSSSETTNSSAGTIQIICNSLISGSPSSTISTNIQPGGYSETATAQVLIYNAITTTTTTIPTTTTTTTIAP